LEQLLKPLDQLVNASDGRLRLRSPAEPAQRLPGLRLLTVPDSRADDLAFLFDQAGLAVSTGAACHSGVAGPSHVLLAIGCNKTEAAAGVRISLGWSSTADDVTALVAALPAVLAQARQANQ
jgi:cysteine desulfurase